MLDELPAELSEQAYNHMAVRKRGHALGGNLVQWRSSWVWEAMDLLLERMQGRVEVRWVRGNEDKRPH